MLQNNNAPITLPTQTALNQQLLNAAKNGRIDEVARLINAGADVNTADHSGTPLIHGIIYGDGDMVRLLIDRGAGVNTTIQGDSTPLMFAAFFGNIDMVQLLVDAGAVINISNHSGKTARGLAQQRGHMDVIELIDAITVVQNHRRALQTFLMGTRRHERNFSIVRRLPVDMLGMIATQVVANPKQRAQPRP